MSTSHAAAAQRVDLYATVHKGVRKALFEAVVRLGSADLQDAASARSATGAVLDVLRMLDVHTRVENAVIQPRLEALAPFVARMLAGDHQGHEREMSELRALCERVIAAAPAERPAIGRDLYRRLALFAADQLQHMAREEEQGNRALWACLSDEALLEIQARIVGSFTPDQLLDQAALVTPALDPEERQRLLGGISRRAPPQVVDRLLERLRALLGPEEFGRLALALPRPE